MAKIELTETQREFVDWMMGVPWIVRFGDDDVWSAGMDEKKKPKLEGDKLIIPDKEVVEGIIGKYGEIRRYQDIAKDAIYQDISPQKYTGIVRALNNLEDKIKNKMDKLEEAI